MRSSQNVNRAALIHVFRKFIRTNTVSSRSNAALATAMGRMLQKGGFRVFYQRERIRGKSYVKPYEV